MKFKTLSTAVMVNNSDIKTLKIYYGYFAESNLILNIKDIVNATKQEGNLLLYIEENEEVNSFVIDENTLSVSLK